MYMKVTFLTGVGQERQAADTLEDLGAFPIHDPLDAEPIYIIYSNIIYKQFDSQSRFQVWHNVMMCVSCSCMTFTDILMRGLSDLPHAVDVHNAVG